MLSNMVLVVSATGTTHDLSGVTTTSEMSPHWLPFIQATIPPMAEEDAPIKPVPILAAWAYDPIPEEDALDTKELKTQSFIRFSWVKATNADKRCSKA